MTDWTDIHPDFTEELVKEWTSNGFACEEVKEWINIGFQVKDAYFCAWLRDNKNLTSSETLNYNTEELWGEYIDCSSSEYETSVSEYSDYEEENWTDIHEDFGEETYQGSGETYQQEWEEVNITKQEAKEWIKLGFKPDGLYCVKKWKNQGFEPPTAKQWIELGFAPNTLNEVKEWENCNFSPAETKTWLEIGLDKGKYGHGDWEFVSWLRTNNYIPELVKNDLEQLRSDYSQYWLTNHYPNHSIKELYIDNENLKGELNLSQYQQLERLNCSYNKLTNIILPTNPTSLKELCLWNNNFNQDLSFLVPCINLEELYLWNNKFTGSLKPLKDLIKLTYLNISNTRLTGSLDYLSGMKQLKKLYISNTDINEVQIDKLPRSLKKIEYSTDERPNCKLTAIVPLLKKHFGNHGRCLKCHKLNTSELWCQPCAEKEWKNNIRNLTGKEVIEKFIQKQKNLKWIPYEQFTEIKHIADGGFSKVYSGRWKREDKEKKYWDIVLKNLTNSQNIALEFLNEVANTKLVDYTGYVVPCRGISQNPTTKNYVIVMEYIEGCNLRQYLQKKVKELSLKNKIDKLYYISEGLRVIHKEELIHKDLHSGNILVDDFWSYVTDLGLCRPANEADIGKIYGILSYIAPEVLQGKSYTKKSDIYSFGIVMHELLTNNCLYTDSNYDEFLAVKICQGLRPNIDKFPIPQEIKDLIKRCWDSNPNKRPTAKELKEIFYSWRCKKDGELIHQVKETEYNLFSKNTPYQIHPSATLTSKMIDTDEITKKLKTMEYSQSQMIVLESSELTKELENLSVRTKRQLSLSSQNEPLPQNKKSTGITRLLKEINIEEKEFQTELMEIDNNQFSQQIDIENLNLGSNSDWTNIHSTFTNELIQSWTNHNFTYQQTQEWINIGLQPTDHNFCAWLRDTKHFIPEQVLNHGNLNQLNQEFFIWWQQNQLQSHQQIPSKRS